MKQLFPATRLAQTTIRLATMAAILTVGAGLAAAQTDTGRVTGTVADATGAVIPGAIVTLTNTDNNAVETKTSGPDGSFIFPGEQRGHYKVQTTMPGFATAVQQFDLQVSQVQQVNFSLQPGSESTTVEVTTAAPVIDTETSSTGETISGRQVTELPLNGRNFTGLALLTPGVTRGQYGNSASGVNGDAETFRNSSSGGGSLSDNGLRPQANNYILDGIDNNEALVNTLDFFPNLEGTQEFRINTSTAPAEFGRAGGAVVQSSIKSGTNEIHGSAFWFARSNLFDANPVYQFRNGFSPQPNFKRNTFGGSLGMPLIKDKLFLFGDYQGLRENQPLNAEIINVPTAQMRTGDFSQLLGQNITYLPTQGGCSTVTTAAGRTFYTTGYVDRNTGLPVAQTSPNAQVANDYFQAQSTGAIFDPTTCSQWNYNGQANVIDPGRINSAGKNYLNAYDATNLTGTNNGTQNNRRVIRQDIRQFNTFDARLDFQPTTQDRAFARFTYDNSNFTRTSRLTQLPAGFGSGANLVHGRGYALGETHTFTANVLNELRLGYNRYTFRNDPVFSGVPISADLGIVNANRTPNLGGGALIGGNGKIEYTGDYGRYAVPENTYEINDAVTWIHKQHSFKFGASGIRRDVAFFRPIAGKGYFQLANGDFTGFETAELLAGFSDNYSIGAQDGFFGTRNYEVGVFGQDDWKVTRNLTLNLGVRWDLITYPVEEHNRQAALDPNTGYINLAGQDGFSRSIINNNFRNFSPRVGFAYDMYGTGRTVLRGGYGIFYFLDRGGIDNQLGQQVPYGGSVSYGAASGYRVALTGQAAMNTNVNTENSTAVATNALPLPGFPDFNRLAPPVGSNVFSVYTTEKTPNVQQYNLQLQQQFGTRTQFTLGYVGNKSTHLATGYNYNYLPGLAGMNTPRFAELGSSAQVVLNVNDGVSHYNSLQTQLNYKASKGLILTTSYTWSHNIDNTDGYLGFYSISQLYAYDHSLNKGNSSLDQRNVFAASAVYDLPFGRGQQFGSNAGRAVDLLIGGWQMNTVVQAESGTPFSILYSQYGGTFTQRADAIGQIKYPHSINGAWISGTFQRPTGLQGNTGRNQFFGPGMVEGDVSLFKTLHITDRVHTELRAEVFNVTNTPQFTNPDSNLNDGNPYSSGTFNPDGGSFGRIGASSGSGTRNYSERQMQMAIRVTF
ncbi:MAG: TonB-dependent receptor [Acidobacteriaceae bacterium]|nr:TonB-dependent receptor [Acidobacteriaceae bacterium]